MVTLRDHCQRLVAATGSYDSSRFSKEIPDGQESLVVIGILVGAFGLSTFGSASASTVSPNDPSPYCRDTISIPFGTSLTRAGGGHYNAGVEGDARISCNGSATVTVTLVLHYHTNPCQGGCGAKTGATFHCSGSCDPYVTFNRTGLFCGYHYTFNDYVQITGTWSGGGTSGKFTGNGSQSHGSAYNPPAVCS